MKPGDLIKTIPPPDAFSPGAALWAGPDGGALIVERIPNDVILMVIVELPYREGRTQLLVISPRQRIGFIMADCVELIP